ENLAITEKMLRQELAAKEEVLRQQYQTQLGQSTSENQITLEAHRKKLNVQFEEAKAALNAELLQKERNFALEAHRRQAELSAQYETSLETERRASQTQIQKALENADRHQKALEKEFQQKQVVLANQALEQEK